MRPNFPEHADKTEPVPGAPRFEVRRVLVDYAFPVHGNLHNPTPRYRWHLLLDGHLVDQDSRRQTLVDAARQSGAAESYRADPEWSEHELDPDPSDTRWPEMP